MGCGVSKEEITEPSRIQTVVVNVGSPESHLKAHEAAAQQNHGLIGLVATQCNGPPCAINNIVDLDNSVLHNSTLALSDGLQPLVESSQEYDDNNVQKEDHHTILPQQTTTKDLPCLETPQIQVVQDSPLFRSNNGLVGTLAGLDEILGIQEAGSLKLAIKATAEKIMNYGGVLHSLEDQVGGFSYPLCNGDTSIELEYQANDGQEVLGSTTENHDRIESPILTRSPKPILEGFRKKLPPILTPPNSSLIDKTSIVDPFAKTPFPIHCQPRIEEIQDVTQTPQPLSPQLPHTTEMVAIESIKDITVMEGELFGCDESQSPPSLTLSRGLHCDVDNISSPEALEAHSSLETLEARQTSDGIYDSNIIIPQSCHNIIVCNVIEQFGEKTAVNMIGPLTPFSTCSQRIEYLEEGELKPLSSDEFYS